MALRSTSGGTQIRVEESCQNMLHLRRDLLHCIEDRNRVALIIILRWDMWCQVRQNYLMSASCVRNNIRKWNNIIILDWKFSERSRVTGIL